MYTNDETRQEPYNNIAKLPFQDGPMITWTTTVPGIVSHPGLSG